MGRKIMNEEVTVAEYNGFLNLIKRGRFYFIRDICGETYADYLTNKKFAYIYFDLVCEQYEMIQSN